MKAVSRFGKILLAGALALAPAIACAQEAPPPASDTGAVGPTDLQNFSLNGTVTRPSDQPAAVAPKRQPQTRTKGKSAPGPVQPSTASSAPPSSANFEPSSAAPVRTRSASATTRPEAPRDRAPEAVRSSTPSAITVPLPKLDASTSTSATLHPAGPTFAPAPPASAPESEHKFPILPWLLAALALGAGGAFLFLRNRGHAALAGGPPIDAFTAPGPAPAPTRAPPAPAPIPAPAPGPRAEPRPAPVAAPAKPVPIAAGIVSTRLRPWIDIGFTPQRCVLENERVTVDFEIELFNSGSAPARAVLVEASLFNAGPTQDRDVGAFFANPVGEGERIVVIPPLKRIAVKTQVAVPRAQMQAYDLAGRQVIVPVIAFNALYRWSGGEGQTSVSYLLGRDTKGEKVGPFRLDLGPHIFRGIAGRLLPAGVRQ